MRELVKEDQYQIHHDEENGWLYVDWTGYQTIGSVQQGCERMLTLIVEYRLIQVLNDNSRVLGIWSGASEWVAVDWFPRMKQAGLQAFAWVYSPSRFSQISTDATLAFLDTPSVGVRVFYNSSEAQAWLQSQKD